MAEATHPDEISLAVASAMLHLHNVMSCRGRSATRKARRAHPRSSQSHRSVSPPAVIRAGCRVAFRKLHQQGQAILPAMHSTPELCCQIRGVYSSGRPAMGPVNFHRSFPLYRFGCCGCCEAEGPQREHPLPRNVSPRRVAPLLAQWSCDSTPSAGQTLVDAARPPCALCPSGSRLPAVHLRCRGLASHDSAPTAVARNALPWDVV